MYIFKIKKYINDNNTVFTIYILPFKIFGLPEVHLQENVILTIKNVLNNAKFFFFNTNKIKVCLKKLFHFSIIFFFFLLNRQLKTYSKIFVYTHLFFFLIIQEFDVIF